MQVQNPDQPETGSDKFASSMMHIIDTVHTFLIRHAARTIPDTRVGPTPPQWEVLNVDEQKRVIADTCSKQIFRYCMRSLGYIQRQDFDSDCSPQSYRYVDHTEVLQDLSGHQHDHRFANMVNELLRDYINHESPDNFIMNGNYNMVNTFYLKESSGRQIVTELDVSIHFKNLTEYGHEPDDGAFNGVREQIWDANTRTSHSAAMRGFGFD